MLTVSIDFGDYLINCQIGQITFFGPAGQKRQKYLLSLIMQMMLEKGKCQLAYHRGMIQCQ